MPVPSAPGRPTRRSIMSSGMSGEMRADPVREKVRAVGSQKLRDRAGLHVLARRDAGAPQPGHRPG